ncbi:MAG: MFS transporter [Bacteroidales bacterium]|nr:MFS transporter [Bacteroidales bacterium]
MNKVAKTAFNLKGVCWIALALLVVPMFGSYFFDDMFSTVSAVFSDPSLLELGWDTGAYGKYTSGYSVLCIFGGLVLCGMLLDKWGVRITGSIFVGLMVGGAALVTWAITAGLAPSLSLNLAYAGCMIFGLGSEIAGVAVTRSIAKWFKTGPMALAMGLQLAIARLGTAAAFLLAPALIREKAGAVYTLAETARPAFVGLALLLVGGIFWAIFVALDARFDKVNVIADPDRQSPDETFRFSDVLKVLGNKNWWLIALLCVFFYSSIIAFKKFTGAILVPRFGVSATAAGMMATILPFATVVFAPLFGLMVDRKGRGTRWMLLGAVLALCAHLLIGFAPSGQPFFGYLSMILLGFSYSLVPAAMWPSVPKIVPEKMLGTAFALIYWVQNLGLWGFKRFAGKMMAPGADAASAPVNTEIMFTAVCLVALALAFALSRSSRRNPELKLDEPNSR